MRRERFKISYVRKSFAKRSLIAISLSGAAILLGFLALRISFAAQGDAGLNAAAFAFCSLLVSTFSIGYAGLSFFEEEKNYLLAKISLLISTVIVVIWLLLILLAKEG